MSLRSRLLRFLEGPRKFTSAFGPLFWRAQPEAVLLVFRPLNVSYSDLLVIHVLLANLASRCRLVELYFQMNICGKAFCFSHAQLMAVHTQLG